jgi:hypothetical protein
VQLEDKLVDGREAARAELQDREDVMQHGEDALPAPRVEAVRDAGVEQRAQLLSAIRMILDRQTVRINQLQLPQLEAHALEALQVASSGKSSDLGQFVYASDRRDLLEQALGVLQPNLGRADDQTARELHAQFDDLAARVAELRHRLTGLEDSQDELLEGHQKAALEAGAAGPGDKPTPKPTPSPSDPDAPRPATTLTGPELPPQPAPATTLTGPELAERPRPPTSLVGPELPPQAPPATTLTGPELPPQPAPATTLTGAELAPEATAASSLGDATEIDAKAKRPWWRRPFG